MTMLSLEHWELEQLLLGRPLKQMLKQMRNLLKQQFWPGRPGGGQHAGDFFPSRLVHDGEAGEKLKRKVGRGKGR